MSYGPNWPHMELRRRPISTETLRWAKPADIPVSSRQIRSCRQSDDCEGARPDDPGNRSSLRADEVIE